MFEMLLHILSSLFRVHCLSYNILMACMTAFLQSYCQITTSTVFNKMSLNTTYCPPSDTVASAFEEPLQKQINRQHH